MASKIKTIGESLLEIDPDYRNGGAYRLLGALNLYTPRIPLFLAWPSQKKAAFLFKKASELYPDHPGNYLALAKCYLHIGQNRLALPLLKKVIQSTARKEFLIEDLRLNLEAQEMYFKLSPMISNNIKTLKK